VTDHDQISDERQLDPTPEPMRDPTPETILDDVARTLARAANVAAVTTLLPDGTPMTHPMWIDIDDDDHLILNTEVGRQKFRNVTRDPRVTIALWADAGGFPYREVRGEVVETITGPEARTHIDQLSFKYTGHAYANPIGSDRVILRVRPRRLSGGG
jgi:PPOX class probable F420-dependent enzyme